MSAAVEALLRESTFPGNTAAFTDLKLFMEKGAVVGFTGAGVSVPMCPTWFGLLTKLLNEAGQKGLITDSKIIQDCKELIESEPLELAGYLEEAFGKKPFRSRLADIFRNPTGVTFDARRWGHDDRAADSAASGRRRHSPFWPAVSPHSRGWPGARRRFP